MKAKNKYLRVRTPFPNGPERLLSPGEHWFGSYTEPKGRGPQYKVYYFHEDKVTNGLASAIGRLLNGACSLRLVSALRSKKAIKKRGKWWFVRLPVIPATASPSPTEVMEALHGMRVNALQKLTQEFWEQAIVVVSTLQELAGAPSALVSRAAGDNDLESL